MAILGRRAEDLEVVVAPLDSRGQVPDLEGAPVDPLEEVFEGGLRRGPCSLEITGRLPAEPSHAEEGELIALKDRAKKAGMNAETWGEMTQRLGLTVTRATHTIERMKKLGAEIADFEKAAGEEDAE